MGAPHRAHSTTLEVGWLTSEACSRLFVGIDAAVPNAPVLGCVALTCEGCTALDHGLVAPPEEAARPRWPACCSRWILSRARRRLGASPRGIRASGEGWRTKCFASPPLGVSQLESMFQLPCPWASSSLECRSHVFQPTRLLFPCPARSRSGSCLPRLRRGHRPSSKRWERLRRRRRTQPGPWKPDPRQPTSIPLSSRVATPVRLQVSPGLSRACRWESRRALQESMSAPQSSMLAKSCPTGRPGVCNGVLCRPTSCVSPATQPSRAVRWR